MLILFLTNVLVLVLYTVVVFLAVPALAKVVLVVLNVVVVDF